MECDKTVDVESRAGSQMQLAHQDCFVTAATDHPNAISVDRSDVNGTDTNSSLTAGKQ